MRPKIYLFKLMLLLSLAMKLFAQKQNISELNLSRDKTYTEAENPKAINPLDWEGSQSLNISWASTDIRYKKEERPNIPIKRELRIQAWRGEKVSAQALVWGTRELKALNFKLSKLIHINRVNQIQEEHLNVSFVRYVLTDGLNQDGLGTCGCRKDQSRFPLSLVADPIDHISKSLELKKYSTRPLWLSIKVPQNCQAGTYKGRLIILDGKKVIGSLKLELEVIDRDLPPANEWSYHLDLWQNPFAIARYHDVCLWSKEHFELMKPYMKMYQEAGGKVITTSIINKPWNGQTYDPFLPMITWIKKADGSWDFDFTVFDMWVEFMISMGINKQINCYSMIPWKLEFQYFDQASNSLQNLKTNPSEALYQEVWTKMLNSFAHHLKEKGWFDITHISMDERPKDVMLKTLSIIQKAGFKISLAGALHPELSEHLDDYSVALRMKYSEKQKEKRAKEGKTTTFYTSCEEPYPNTFTFSSPAESEWLGWYATKENLDGYLRWAYISWPKDPLHDSRFTTWGAGDTFLVYPWARSSIRFERMIAGIQAFEKIHVLKKIFRQEGKDCLLDKLYQILKNFDENKLKDISASVIVREANRELNKISSI